MYTYYRNKDVTNLFFRKSKILTESLRTILFEACRPIVFDPIYIGYSVSFTTKTPT